MTAKIRKLWALLLCSALVTTQFPTIVSADGMTSPTSEKEEQIVTFTAHPKPTPGIKVQYSMTYGDEPHNAAASTSGDGEITYSSSDDNIAIVDENGSVNAVSAGEVTITATAAETDTYNESSESFNLRVDPKEVSITGITAKERQYDPEDFYVDLDFTNASINGMVPGDDLNIDITNATGRTNQFDKVTGSKEVYVEGVVLAGLKKDAYKLKMNTIDGIYLGIDLTVDILPKQMDSSMITDIPAQIHTGLPITPELTVTHGNTILNMGENKDYTVEYTNNTNIGTATATITGHGKYTGTASKDFNIDKPKPAATVTAVDSTLTYGDTLTINVTDLTAARNSLAENKVGLYLADGTELATADVTNDSAALTYDTKGKKLLIGESTLTIKYGGSDTLSTSDSLGTVTVTLEPKALAASVTSNNPAASKPYDGNADFNNIPLTLSGVENLDTVTATCSGSADSPYAGTYSLTNPTVTLDGADKDWYTTPTSVSGDVTITAADQTLTSSYADKENAYALSSDGEEIDLTTLVAGMASGNTPAFMITDGGECAILNGTVLISTAISGTVIITVSANAYDLNNDGTNEYSASDNLLIYIKVNNTQTTPTALSWDGQNDASASTLGASPGDTITIENNNNGAGATLTIDVENITVTSNSTPVSGVCLSVTASTMTIQDLNLTAQAGKSSINFTSDSTLTIAGTCILTCGVNTRNASGNIQAAIYSSENLTINGGQANLTAIGGYGIYSGGSLNLAFTDKLTAYGKNGPGIFAGSNLTVSGTPASLDIHSDLPDTPAIKVDGVFTNNTSVPIKVNENTPFLWPSDNASLNTVFGQAVIAGAEIGTADEPKTVSITVYNSVTSLNKSDIEASHTGAVINLYSDAAFSQNADTGIALIENNVTHAYVKITAENTGALYYHLSIKRKAHSLLVTTTRDTEIPGDEGTSLREAISNAKNGNTVTFSDDLFGTDGTTPIVISLVAPLTGWGKSITIQGRTDASDTPIVTLDADPIDMSDYILRGASLSLTGLIIKNGNAGGVKATGSLTATNCAFIGNSTKNGSGGGIFTFNNVTATNCTFIENITNRGSGGGIYASNNITATNCDFIRNSENGIYGDNITATNCTFTGNSGGGIYGKIVTAANCTFTGNSGSSASAIFADDVYLYHCTLGKNNGSRGIWADNMFLYNSIITGSGKYGEIKPVGGYTGTSILGGEFPLGGGDAYDYNNVFGSNQVTNGLLYPLSTAVNIKTATPLTSGSITVSSDIDAETIINALATDATGMTRESTTVTYGAVEISSSPHPIDVPGVALNQKVAYAGVEWWVIGLNDRGINPQNGTMTLLSKDNLFQTRFDTNENRGGTANNNYNGSLLQKEMINYYNNLKPGEQAMILPRNVLDGMIYNSSTKEHSGTLIGTHYIWPLSREEAEKLDGNIRRSSPPGDGIYWLTRSAFSDSTTHAIIVDHWGTMNHRHPVTYLDNGKFGRPALTVNLSDVLFTSNAADDKPAVKTGLHAVTPLSGTVKLTVKNDSLLSLDLDSTEPITAKSGRTVSLNYTGAQTGTGHSVSVLICDPDSNIRYYGRPGNCENSSDGTITFTVPGNLPNGDYKLLVFNEQVNGKNMTDFASTPVEIDLKVVEPEVVDVPGAALHKSVRFAGKDWWVIGLNGNGVNSKSGTATLLSKDNLIANTQFSGNDAYGPSKLRAAMENFYSNLSADEQALILPRELDNVQGTGSVSNPSITLSGDHYVWPLSKAEAETLPQDTILANGSSWWLRSTSTPNAGYYIDIVTAEGLLDYAYSYNVSDGRPALTLDLSKLNTITATAGANGKISPSGTMHVFPDSNQTFTITAENGYEIDDVLVNNTSVKNQLSGNTYTFTNITENKTIAASFRKISIPHTHTYSSEWKSDDTRHWRECACGAKEEEALHDYTPWTIIEKTDGDNAGTSSRECKVCGYKRTETNTYRTLTDPETGIQVSGYFTSDAALSVKKDILHEEGTCPVCDEIRARQAAGELIALYDITLSSGIHNGGVKISFPVDKKCNGQPLVLLHCKDRQEERREEKAKEGFVTGTFTSLSPFAVLETTKVQSVKLTPSSLTLELGKSRQLQATISPTDAFDKKVTWKTSNKSVATVSTSGLVKAVKAGTATITCAAADGSGAKATCKVTVKNTSTPILIMKGTAGKNSVRLNWNQISNADGYEIYGSRCGDNYRYKKIKTITKGTVKSWTHSKLKAVTFYKYYIKAYKLSGGKKLYLRVSKTCHAVTTGGQYTNVKSVLTTFTDITLAKGKTRQISARIIPVKKSRKLAYHMPEFRYKTTNSKVATVTASGKIKAVGKGKCSVYVYANNGVTRRIQVTVK